MTDRLKSLEVFVRAVRLGGLSAAGRELGMPPAVAARRLSALEERLGTRLVNRTTRHLGLTEAGATYLEHAERILAELAEADAEVTAQSTMIEGLLRISAPATFGVMHVVPLVTAFHQEYPRVTVELGLDDRYIDLIDERWDAAVRVGRLADSGLIARKLAPMRMSLGAAPAYLERAGTPRTLADLSDHDCLGYTLASLAGTTFWGFDRDGNRHVPIRGSLHASNGEALVRAAIFGQGLVYGPRFIAAPAFASGELVEVHLEAEYLDLGAVYALTHPTRRSPAKVRAWVDFLAARLPAMATEW